MNKQKQKQPKTCHCSSIFLPLQHLSVFPGGIRSSSGVSHSISFRPISFTCKGSLQRVIVLIQGLWFLEHHYHWILTESPLNYPEATPSHGDPVGTVPQDKFLHEL